MRAAAWISRDPALTAVYEQERDLHTETAAVVAGVPVDRGVGRPAAGRQGGQLWFDLRCRAAHAGRKRL